MADQRLIMKFEDREIVIAVRHGTEWRSANNKINDIGGFLNSLPIEGNSEIEIGYEHDLWYCDPAIYYAELFE